MIRKPVSRDSLEPGDHISTPCSGHLVSHHGIYVGKAKVKNPYNNEEEHEIDDAVIHFRPPNGKSSSSSSTVTKSQCRRCFYTPQRSGVVICCLDCFLDGAPVHVYLHLIPKPPDEVVQTAFSYLEKKRDFGKYNAVFNNCEDFTNFCKTGIRKSSQVATGALAFGAPGVVAYGVAKFFHNIFTRLDD